MIPLALVPRSSIMMHGQLGVDFSVRCAPGENTAHGVKDGQRARRGKGDTEPIIIIIIRRRADKE